LLLTSCNTKNLIHWKGFSDALLEQETGGQPIMFFFYSNHCIYCKLMERSSLNNKEIAEMINKNFIPVKLNIENKMPLGRNLPSPYKLATTFRVRGVPVIFFVNKEHKIFEKIEGYQPVFKLKKFLKEAIEKNKENQDM